MSVVWDSGSLAQQVLARIPRDGVRLLAGQVLAVDGTGLGVTCNVAGVTITGVRPGNETVQAGDAVLILASGGVYYISEIIAPTNRPITGTVSAVPAGSASITVSTGAGSVVAGWLAQYTPVVGDSVWIAWLGSTPVVMGKQGNTAPLPPPTPPTPPPPPPPSTTSTTTTGTTTFTASSSGTYRDGEWMDDSITNGNVMQGDYGYGMNSGAWFYGGRIASSLSGAVVTAASIWLRRTSGGVYAAQSVHLCRVTQDSQPGGALTVDTGNEYEGVSLAVGESGWYPIPVGLVQALVDSGGSVGVRPLNPYLRLYGVPNSGQAGALKITWSRTD